MPNLLDQSFLNDMNESYMISNIVEGGFGNQIDFLVDKINTEVKLFESAEEAAWRSKYASYNNNEND